MYAFGRQISVQMGSGRGEMKRRAVLGVRDSPDTVATMSTFSGRGVVNTLRTKEVSIHRKHY